MIGRTLGHYRILREIAAGGMGVVYEAEDTHLERRVALKLLPEAVAHDPAMVERFRREARLSSALNHPHICTIYEINQDDGQYYLALELLEGKTLADLIASQPLPVREVLALGIQVSDALEAAHASGIIHRDIKPHNIFMTSRGQAKILDFGLATSTLVRRRVSAQGAEQDTISQWAQTTTLTKEGSTFGTVPYMSPEQALGEDLDARTDLFSLGIVLYEMCAGIHPFKHNSPIATVNAIINEVPRKLTTDPPELAEVIDKCLQKKRSLRYQGAAELKADLKRIETQLEHRDALSQASPIRKWAAALGVLVILLAGYLIARFWPNRGASRLPQTELTQLTTTEGLQEFPAWSPDEQSIAYSREVNGFKKIFIKPLQGEPRQVTTGEFDDIQPQWTPEGQSILFVRSNQPKGKLEPGDVFGKYEGGDVWKRDLTSGKEEKLIGDAFSPSFSPDGKHIAVDTSRAGPRRIWIFDAQGLNPQQVTSDTSEAVDHIEPHWAPDGANIVFQNVERTQFSIKIANVATHELRVLTDGRFGDINPVWSRSGKFIYFSSPRGGGLNIWRIEVSRDGRAKSAPQQLTVGSGQDVQLAMAPNGGRLAFATLRQNADLWRLPVSIDGKALGDPKEVLGTTREDSRGSWSPDGTRIAFNSDRGGEMNIYVHSLQDGTTTQVTTGPGGDYQPQWSSNGNHLAFFSSRAGNTDIWTVELATRSLQQITSDPEIDINPFFSPDGRKIAFQSDRSGRMEVWVMNVNGSEQRQLSETGVTGHFLRWSPDGQSIYFRCPCGGEAVTYRVSVNGGTPTMLNRNIKGGSHMSFSPDHSMIMDVVGHKTLWVSHINQGEPTQVYEFTDGESRIDYPVWSPDGKWILFDRFRPQGGDIWEIKNVE